VHAWQGLCSVSTPNLKLYETKVKSPEWPLVNSGDKHRVQGVLKAIFLQKFNYFAVVCILFPRKLTTSSTYS